MGADAKRIATVAARAAIIRPLAEGGMTAQAIADQLGMTRCGVAGFCSRQGIRLLGRDKPKAPEEPQPMPVPPHRGARLKGKPLTAKGCRFPAWDHVERPTHRYCGAAPRAPGEPYCLAHHALTHQRTPVLAP